MPFKLLVYVFGLCISGAFGTIISAENDLTAANQQINKRTDYLQVKINKLRVKQKAQKKQKKKCSEKSVYYRAKEYNSGKHQKYHASLLGVGPYLNKDAIFDGSQLIINVPTVREDSQLLLQQYQLIQECRKLGIPIPNFPRVILTGKLEGQTSYGSTYADLRSGNINFSAAELGTYVQGNSWVSGYMALDYTPNKHRNDSRFFINRAFITIGNLGQLPLYTSIGQIYVPFGRYNSLMVTTPVTQVLGRTRARTLTFGYQKIGDNTFHAEVYGFQGLTNNFSRSIQNNEWGIDIGYKFNNSSCMSGEIGTGYISSLSDSQWIQEMVFSNRKNLRHHIPALNIYGALAINPVMFLTEYIGVIKSFNINDINFTNQGAQPPRPTAFNIEARYTFKTGSKPSSIGVNYGHTSQALALRLPKNRYSIFYNINVWKDTNLALEYRHDVNYPVSTISIGSNSIPTTANVVTTDVGKSENMITAQFDLFF